MVTKVAMIPGKRHRQQLRKMFSSESFPFQTQKATVNHPTILDTASFVHRGENRSPRCQAFIPNAPKQVSVEHAGFDRSKPPAPSTAVSHST